jgi:MFS family permease
MRVALIASLAAIPLFVMAKAFAAVLAIRCVIAVANAFFSPACGALVADLVPRDVRGRVMALIGRGSLMLGSTGGGVGGPSLGMLVVPPLLVASLSAGYLYAYNAAYPWYLSFVFLAGCAVVALFFVRDPREAHA